MSERLNSSSDEVFYDRILRQNGRILDGRFVPVDEMVAHSSVVGDETVVEPDIAEVKEPSNDDTPTTVPMYESIPPPIEADAPTESVPLPEPLSTTDERRTMSKRRALAVVLGSAAASVVVSSWAVDAAITYHGTDGTEIVRIDEHIMGMIEHHLIEKEQ